MVVEGVPVRVQHGGSVAAEEGYLVGQLAALVEGDDVEGAATCRLPVDREVLGVDLDKAHQLCSVLLLPREGETHLHQVRVPGIAADVEVVIAKLLLGGLAKDVSCARARKRERDGVSQAMTLAMSITGKGEERGKCHARYFDARTKRPDMAADSYRCAAGSWGILSGRVGKKR